MFPLVHYFVNSELAAKKELFVSPLTALGALWPDLASGAGYDRDLAHESGDEFYAWCLSHAPQSLALARGVISHGSIPHCVDYYADEAWPGAPDYPKGWCFLQGEPYRQAVAEATRLPENMIWWKAHNFVEMSYELLTDAAHPELKYRLLAAVRDQKAIRLAAETLSAYTGRPQERIAAAFCNTPDIFAIETVDADTLAEKQCLGFAFRHHHHQGNAKAMAALLRRMQQELAAGYPAFIAEVIARTGEVLEKY